MDKQAIIDAMADLEEDELYDYMNEIMDNDGEGVQEALEACQEGMKIVGDRFEEGEYFVGDLIYAGEILTEATIVDPSSQKVIYSLAQQDMVALRAVMRLGWEIPNPISGFRENLGTYSPFAVYLPA